MVVDTFADSDYSLADSPAERTASEDYTAVAAVVKAVTIVAVPVPEIEPAAAVEAAAVVAIEEAVAAVGTVLACASGAAWAFVHDSSAA